MAFNIDYGPIQTAMGLATQAGQADAARTSIGRDSDLLSYLQRAQQLGLQQNAQEIQRSLGQQNLGLEAQRNAATQALAQQQLAANNDYRKSSLASMDSYRQGRNQIGQANADTNAQRVSNQGDYNQGRLDIGQQNADTAGQRADTMDGYRNGLLNVLQQNAQTRQQQAAVQSQQGGDRNAVAAEDMKTRALAGEINGLTKQIGDAQKNFVDPNDPSIVAAKSRLQQIEAGLKTRNDQLLFGGTQVNAGRTMVRQLPAQGQPQQQQQAPAGATPANAVQVSSQQQYDQLPPGAYYVDSNGTLAQKGGAASPR